MLEIRNFDYMKKKKKKKYLPNSWHPGKHERPTLIPCSKVVYFCKNELSSVEFEVP